MRPRLVPCFVTSLLCRLAIPDFATTTGGRHTRAYQNRGQFLVQTVKPLLARIRNVSKRVLSATQLLLLLLKHEQCRAYFSGEMATTIA